MDSQSTQAALAEMAKSLEEINETLKLLLAKALDEPMEQNSEAK